MVYQSVLKSMESISNQQILESLQIKKQEFEGDLSENPGHSAMKGKKFQSHSLTLASHKRIR